MADVVIVGAGLTGLSAAYYLEKNNFFDYKIFEKNDRPGGLLQSVQQDGFTFDYTGHFLHISDPSFYTFLQDITSFAHLDNTQRKSHIFSHDVITTYPFQMNLYGLPTDVIIECLSGYFNRHSHIKKPNNFYDWVLKYFGTGFGKHFFFSYNHKLLAYNLKKVHPSWTGRFVPSTSLAAIIEGALKQKTINNVGYNSNFYYPKNGGIEFIIKKVASKLQNNISTQNTVEFIDPERKIIYFNNGNTEHYKHLINTMPLNQLLKSFINTTKTNWYGISQKLICNAVININMGFSAPMPLSAHWIYFPEKKYPWYRIGFYHNICPALVKQHHTAIYTEFSYNPEKTSFSRAQQQASAALPAMFDFLKITKQDLTTQKLLHLENAYVIYDAWREKNIHNIFAQLQTMNIHSIGRYGGWKYSSMQEAVIDGKTTAEAIHQAINTTQTRVYPAMYNVEKHHTMMHQKASPRQNKTIKKEETIND